MKQIWPLLSLALIAVPMAVPAVAAAEAPTLRGGLDEAVMVLASNKKDRDDRRNSGSNRQRGNDDRQNARQRDDRQDGRQNDNRQNRQVQTQRFDRGNGGQLQNRDDRINRAMSVAGRRGRVLDAGPQGGSVFWVRVATDHGRVDLLVDADSGRIIGER